MAKPRVLAVVLLLSVLLCLCFSKGNGRRVQIMKPFKRGMFSEPILKGKGREMVELEMDYKDPGANTNPRNGAYFNPPNDPNHGH